MPIHVGQSRFTQINRERKNPLKSFFDRLDFRSLLQQDLLHVREGVRILPEDTREYARALQALPQRVANMLLPRAMLAPCWQWPLKMHASSIPASQHQRQVKRGYVT